MWMSETENISFTWNDGHVYNIKDMKVIPVYDQYVKLKINQGDQLDEIASRSEIFGADSESLSYFLFESNIEKLAENKFDLSKLHEIRIPAVG